ECHRSASKVKAQATRSPKTIGRLPEPVGPGGPRRRTRIHADDRRARFRSTVKMKISDEGLDYRSRSQSTIKKSIGDRR
ncbi:hypothetical protein L915_07399, partial [Phytophthora nicotianae]